MVLVNLANSLHALIDGLIVGIGPDGVIGFGVVPADHLFVSAPGDQHLQ